MAATSVAAATPGSATPCPDVEVVFARGSGEPPGVGNVGKAFVDALRPHLGSRSLGVYAVNYPATTDFANSLPNSLIDGMRDESAHVESMAANCAKTKELLGGYSQGAAVTGYVTEAAVPPGVAAAGVPKPVPPQVADHIAAVTMFGTPSEQFLQQYNAPMINIGPLFQPKILELCAPGDGICGAGDNPVAHMSYPMNGMAGQAAAFAAEHL